MILMILGSILVYLRHIPGKLYAIFERFFIIRMEIQDDDESFQWLKLWLAKQLEGTLSVSVCTFLDKKEEVDSEKRIIFTPSPGVYWFFYKGRFVSFYRHRTEPDGKVADQKPRENFVFRIFSRNLKLASDLLQEAKKHAEPKDGLVEIRNCDAYYWNTVARKRPRPLESIFMPNNSCERLLKDIIEFQQSYESYVRRGIPYRRGYFLYGPPGNGKSSLVFGLASQLKMNINVLNLSLRDLNDAKIVDLLGQTDIKTIILIEDIDCSFANRKSGVDKKNSSLTFSGILNALDGIMSQDGRIIFMTSNHPEKLDQALLRPGRADVKMYIGNALREQIYCIFERFYPGVEKNLINEFVSLIRDNECSMAKIQHHLMLYKDDPILAIKNIADLKKVEVYEQ